MLGNRFIDVDTSYYSLKQDEKQESEAELEKGGSGSGNFGHAGRPGAVGGSTTTGGTFYHGTTLARAKKIVLEGIVPGKFRNYDRNVYDVNSKKAAFVTPKKRVAEQYARDNSFFNGRGSAPAIIEVRVPKGEKLYVDTAPETRQYGSKGGAYYKLGKIPQKWIAAVHVWQGWGVWNRQARPGKAETEEDMQYIVMYLSPFVEPEDEEEFVFEKGGSGSGNFGHEGRPGQVGGSIGEGKERDEELLPEDKVVLEDYTTGGHVHINKVARGVSGLSTTAQKKIEDKIAQLDTTLKKLPSWEGTTYRAMTFSSPKNRDAFLESLNGGDKFISDGFLSTTKNKGITGEWITGENYVKIDIEGRTGRDITMLSTTTKEQEVLFPRKTKFEVTGKIRNHITLREL